MDFGGWLSKWQSTNWNSTLTMTFNHLSQYKSLIVAGGAALLLVPLFKYTRTIQQKKQQLQTLPGPPPSNFLLGNISDIKGDFWGAMKRWSDQYGPVFKFQILHTFMIAIGSADLIEEVLIQGQNNYRPGHAWQRADYENYKMAFGSTVINLANEDWFWRKKFLLPAFHNTKLYAFLPQFIEEKTHHFIESVLKPNEGHVIEIDPEFCNLTISVICYCIFGKRIEDVTNHIMSEGIDSLLRKALRHTTLMRVIRQYIPETIEKAQQDITNEVTSLVDNASQELQKSLPERYLIHDMLENPQYTKKNLIEEIVTLILAGHDTTAHTLSFAISLLAQNPKKLIKARKEIHSILEEKGTGPWTPELFGKFVYITAIFKESLRLYSIAPGVLVKSVQDTTLGGYSIPKGFPALLLFQQAHKNPLHYPNPEKFIPERFIPGHPKECKHFLGMSEGAHVCLGKNLAYLEFKIVLATLLNSWQFEIAPGYQVQTENHFTIRPAGGMKVIPTKI